jgi:hypothetical protein
MIFNDNVHFLYKYEYYVISHFDVGLPSGLCESTKICRKGYMNKYVYSVVKRGCAQLTILTLILLAVLRKVKCDYL